MGSRRKVAGLAVCGVLLVLATQVRADAGRPADVPHLDDPAVLDRFVPVGLSRLGDDPDFPALLLANLGEGSPQLLLVILDARNGKATWTLGEDAAIFYLLLSDPTTVQQAFLDEGFAARGRPSGEFTAGGPEEAAELMARLREGHLRCRRLARLGKAI